MKSYVLQLLPNFTHSTNKKLWVRKIISSTNQIFDSVDDDRPPEIEVFYQKLSLQTDPIPPVFPDFELRFPVPIVLERGDPVKMQVPDGTEERFENMQISLECEKSEKIPTFRASPYFLVFRFETVPESEILELDKTVRIPTGRYFVPIVSWATRLIRKEREGWGEYDFKPNDIVQILDVSNITVGGNGPFPLKHFFRNTVHRPHRWTEPNAFNWELRLQAQIHNVEGENIGIKNAMYFVLFGILTPEEEIDRWTDKTNFAVIPVR